MDIKDLLILILNNQTNEYEDKTADINTFKFSKNEALITFNGNDKTYRYHTGKVNVLKNPELISIENTIICVDDIPINGICAVQDFGKYIRIVYENQKCSVYPRQRVSFNKTCLDRYNARVVFNYLKSLSKHVNVADVGHTLLWNYYEKLSIVCEESVLSTYLTNENITKMDKSTTFIFPFGFNLSQKKAVEAAFRHNISIIEGPPGTGKTQTILNIITNAVYRNQTVGVVSGNNSATDNVLEKLEKNGYGFIAALLGNQEKKKHFFETGQPKLPDFSGWKCSAEMKASLEEKLFNITDALTELLQNRITLATLQEEVSKLETEQAHFLSEFKWNIIPLSAFSLYRKWSGASILRFLVDYETIMTDGQGGGLINKLKMFFRYGVYKHRFIEKNQNEIIFSLNKFYYESSIQERLKRIFSLEGKLNDLEFDGLMQQYTELSTALFRDALSDRYEKQHRSEYSLKYFKNKFHAFIRDYPVILSTTHSILSCIKENYLFDYLIIDEASQVDLVTAALAMSCCKNIVIVGDVQQLPQIVPKIVAEKSNALLRGFCLPIAYDYTHNSIISSLMTLYKDDLPRTLLCEHYRCHPKIIRFCNEKFYNNQLVIMTEEMPEDNALQIFRTAPGNHARRLGSGWYNLRQIEVVRDEVLGAHAEKYGDCSAVGIIAPYRDQVYEIKKSIQIPALEVDTVHKYQGREKDTIVFSTVTNNLNSFVDDPNLINVAVSRAVKELIIVTSDKLFKQHGTNIGDLIRYIEYNGLEGSIIKSSKISVFDLLYSEYSGMLIQQMKSMPHISEYMSENLMYGLIEGVLLNSEFNSFRVVLHVPLRLVVKNKDDLNEREKAFVLHPWTHVDFLIFNKLDKEPVLVVEVDGYKYHHQNEKQLERDRLKDGILKKINLPLLRLATNASGEEEKLVHKIRNIIIDSSKQVNEETTANEIDESTEIY